MIKKVLMPFILLFILLFFLFGCNSSEYRIENDALSENGEDESYETLEKGYCFYCGKKYDTRYIIDVANQEIELCKPCRDSLLVNNGAITVNGSTFYPFANVNLYQDDLVTIVIPDDYRQTDVEYGDYYQAQFDYKEIEGIFYLFDWQDMMPFEHTMSDRMGYGFAEIDTTEDGDTEYIDLFAPEIDLDDEYEASIIDIHGIRYYIYRYYRDFSIIRTLKDGILYTFTYFENTDEDYDTDYYSPYIDWIFFVADMVYPTEEQIKECLE